GGSDGSTGLTMPRALGPRPSRHGELVEPSRPPRYLEDAALAGAAPVAVVTERTSTSPSPSAFSASACSFGPTTTTGQVYGFQYSRETRSKAALSNCATFSGSVR